MLANCVADAAAVANVMSGHDASDATSLNMAPMTFVPAPGLPLGGIRVGVPQEYHVEELPDDVVALWQQVRQKRYDEKGTVMHAGVAWGHLCGCGCGCGCGGGGGHGGHGGGGGGGGSGGFLSPTLPPSLTSR